MNAQTVVRPAPRAGSIPERGGTMTGIVQVFGPIIGLGILALAGWLASYEVTTYGSSGVLNPDVAFGLLALCVVGVLAAAPFRLYDRFLALRIAGLAFGFMVLFAGGGFLIFGMGLYAFAQSGDTNAEVWMEFLLFTPALLSFATCAVLLYKVSKCSKNNPI